MMYLCNSRFIDHATLMYSYFLHEVISSFCQETKNWLQLLFLYDLAFYESASTVGQNFI